MWQDIKKLPPGHLLRFGRDNGPVEVCYWKTDVVADEWEVRTEEETDQEFSELFLDAVELRLVAADIPVGVFLSGGLDSAQLRRRQSSLGTRIFIPFRSGLMKAATSQSFPSQGRSPSTSAARYHEVVIDQKQFLDSLPEVVFASDEPLADLTLVPLLALSRLARKDVKVVLSGEGSDEILAGYNFDQSEREFARLRLLQRFPKNALQMGAAFSRLGFPESVQRKADKVANVPLVDWNKIVLPHITGISTRTEKRQLWPGEEHRESSRIIADQYAAAASEDPLQQMLSVYQRCGWWKDLADEGGQNDNGGIA